MKNEPKNEQGLSTLCSRIENTAKTYESLGNYPDTADYFEHNVYYAKKIELG